MTFLGFMGFLFTLIITIKLLLFLLNLLLSNYGRKIGCGVKWTSSKGEYAVILGATGPIGTEYTREFASMGFNLVLISKNADKLKKLETEYKDKYKLKEVKLVHADFSSPESVDTVKNALSSVSSIVALVNCLGISFPPKKFTDYPLGFNSDLINVYVVAPVLLIEMVLPKMVEMKRGVIINYSSQCGRFEFPYFSTFSASKSFISTLSEILSVEYGGDGITIQNIEPLFVQSYMTHFKENPLLISPAMSVYSSMMEVGLEPTTFGQWKHKLAAVVLNILVFLLGPRLTTKIIGCLIGRFVTTENDTPDLTENTATSKIGDDKKVSESKTEDSESASNISKIDSSATSSGVSKAAGSVVPLDSNKEVKTVKAIVPTVPFDSNKDVKINIEPPKKPSDSEKSVKQDSKPLNGPALPALPALPSPFSKTDKEKSNSNSGPAMVKPSGPETGKGLSLSPGSSINGASSTGSSIGGVDSHASSTPSSQIEDSKTKKK